MPDDVKSVIGQAIFEAQCGGKSASAKPLKGFKGAGVLEVVENSDGDTYRAVYTVKFTGAVYTLCAFQKKSKKKAETPKHIMDLVGHRLKLAEGDYRKRYPNIG